MACVRSYPPSSAKECRKILSKVDNINPVCALMLEFEALTGLRYSDYSKLKVGDLHINGQVREMITVIQQKPLSKRLSSGMKERTAKDLSKVDIHINEQCRELIQDLMHLQALNATSDKGQLVFHSSRNKDKAYSIQYLNRILKRVAVELRLNYSLSTHSFRKQFALFFIKRGAGIHDVRDGLGQSSLQATDHYLRTFMSDSKKYTNKISF